MTDPIASALDGARVLACITTIEAIYDGWQQGLSSSRITESLRESGIPVDLSDTQSAGLLSIMDRLGGPR